MPESISNASTSYFERLPLPEGALLKGKDAKEKTLSALTRVKLGTDGRYKDTISRVTGGGNAGRIVLDHDLRTSSYSVKIGGNETKIDLSRLNSQINQDSVTGDTGHRLILTVSRLKDGNGYKVEAKIDFHAIEGDAEGFTRYKLSDDGQKWVAKTLSQKDKGSAEAYFSRYKNFNTPTKATKQHHSDADPEATQTPVASKNLPIPAEIPATASDDSSISSIPTLPTSNRSVPRSQASQQENPSTNTPAPLSAPSNKPITDEASSSASRAPRKKPFGLGSLFSRNPSSTASDVSTTRSTNQTRPIDQAREKLLSKIDSATTEVNSLRGSTEQAKQSGSKDYFKLAYRLKKAEFYLALAQEKLARYDLNKSIKVGDRDTISEARKDLEEAANKRLKAKEKVSLAMTAWDQNKKVPPAARKSDINTGAPIRNTATVPTANGGPSGHSSTPALSSEPSNAKKSVRFASPTVTTPPISTQIKTVATQQDNDEESSLGSSILEDAFDRGELGSSAWYLDAEDSSNGSEQSDPVITITAHSTTDTPTDENLEIVITANSSLSKSE